MSKPIEKAVKSAPAEASANSTIAIDDGHDHHAGPVRVDLLPIQVFEYHCT